jgi:hypothetical protein
MGDSSNSKPGSRPAGGVPPGKPSPASQNPQTPAQEPPAGRSGRVVHDDRGNAVWDWVKDTARIAIDSTSRLLKRLEVPELKVEDTQNNPLSLESDRDPGGGYDPYGSSTPSKGSPLPKGSARREPQAPISSRGSTSGNSHNPGNTNNVGGGYDPYGKGVTRSRERKCAGAGGCKPGR